jgi:hypothetical protein
MTGLIYIAKAPTIVATSGDLQIDLESGGDHFRFILSRHAAIAHREQMMREGWPVLCAPNAPVVPLYAGCRGCEKLPAKREKYTR